MTEHNKSKEKILTRTIRAALKAAVQAGTLVNHRGLFRLAIDGCSPSPSQPSASEVEQDVEQSQGASAKSGTEPADCLDASAALMVDSEEERASSADLQLMLKDAITAIKRKAATSEDVSAEMLLQVPHCFRVFTGLRPLQPFSALACAGSIEAHS